MDYDCEERGDPNVVGLLFWGMLLGIVFFCTSFLMGASFLVAFALYSLGSVLGLCATAALCILRSKPSDASGEVVNFNEDRPARFQ